MKRLTLRCFNGFILIGAILSSTMILLILSQLIGESLPFLQEVPLRDFLFGTVWKPLNKTPSYGIFPMLLGTLSVSGIALLIALPLGVGCALFLCFCIKPSKANFCLIFVDLLAGMPSVILGFMGLTLLVKAFEQALHMTTGESVLAGGLLLGIMILPYVISGCAETFDVAKSRYYLGALSLGVSKWSIIFEIVLPFSKRSIYSHGFFAFSRALGETMAVMMVIGNSPIIPRLLGRTQTIPSLLALELGSSSYGSMHYHALYATALVLMSILGCCQVIGHLLKRKEHSHEN
ncbi:MAG: phosphate ABC transporter permease subunit PstC [Cellulosilyticaceae bacterium]